MPALRRAAVTVVAAAAVAASMLPASAHADCAVKQDIGGNSFHVRVCNIPDYDQRRIDANDLGAAHYAFTGMPGDGSCHCVPTSFMNVLGFYEKRGVSIELLDDFDWAGRSFTVQSEPGSGSVTEASYDTGSYSAAEASAYQNSNELLLGLGVGSSVQTTSSCGTSFSNLERAAIGAMPILSQGVSFAYSFYGVGDDTPEEMAEALAYGATVLIAYGRYTVSGVSGNSLIFGARSGGHVMTLRSSKGDRDAATATISMRDPADDEAAQTGITDRVRQSGFKTTEADLKRFTQTFGGANKTLWLLDEIESDNTGRFLDGWMAIWPQIYVTIDEEGLSISGQLINFHGGVAARARASQAGSLRSVTRRFNIGAVVDATFVPRTGEVVFAREGSTRLEAIDVVTRERRRIGAAPAGLVDLETNARRGDVFALGARELVRVEPRRGKRVRRSLPSGFESIAYSPERDRLVAVSARNASARLFTGSSLEAKGARSLPRTLTGGSGRLATSFDRDGRLLLRREGSATIRRATVGDTVSADESVRATPIADGSGFVATDRGTTLSVVGGRLVEVGPRGRVLPRSPFRNVRLRGRLVSIIHSAADIAPELRRLTVDQRVEGNPAYPELARGAPVPGSRGLRVMADEAADAAMDAP